MSQNGHHQNSANNKFWRGCGEKRILLHCWWECKLIQSLWKMVSVQFSSVQSLSRVRLFATPWIAAFQASLSITDSRSSLRLMSIESVVSSSHLNSHWIVPIPKKWAERWRTAQVQRNKPLPPKEWADFLANFSCNSLISESECQIYLQRGQGFTQKWQTFKQIMNKSKKT